MLLAGIQAEFGLDPRLKHSGVTVLGVASLHASGAIFKGVHEEHEVKKYKCETFVRFVCFVVRYDLLVDSDAWELCDGNFAQTAKLLRRVSIHG
jgi:hypothetical protein